MRELIAGRVGSQSGREISQQAAGMPLEACGDLVVELLKPPLNGFCGLESTVGHGVAHGCQNLLTQCVILVHKPAGKRNQPLVQTQEGEEAALLRGNVSQPLHQLLWTLLTAHMRRLQEDL